MPGGDQTPRARHWLGSIILLVVTLLMVALVLEVGGRWFMRGRVGQLMATSPALGWTDVHQYDPDLMWTVKPNLDGVTMVNSTGAKATIHTNDTGLRNPPIQPKNGRLRILAIGASVTFGAGVNDAETWPAQLQALLDERTPGRYDVINAGVSGYTAWQGLRYLELYGLALEPDIVIACFGQNEHVVLQENGIRDVDWERPPASGFVALVKEAAKKAGLVPPRGGISERKYRMGFADFVDALLRINEVCTEKKAMTAFLVWPYEHELSDPPKAPNGLIRGVARFNACPVVDLFDMLAQTQEKVYDDGLHMNVRGNRLVAEFVARELKLLPAAGGGT